MRHLTVGLILLVILPVSCVRPHPEEVAGSEKSLRHSADSKIELSEKLGIEWRLPLKDVKIRKASIRGSYIYVETTGDTIYAIDKDYGITRWQHKLEEQIKAPPYESAIRRVQREITALQYYDHEKRTRRWIPEKDVTQVPVYEMSKWSLRPGAEQHITKEGKASYQYDPVKKDVRVYLFRDPRTFEEKRMYEDQFQRVKRQVEIKDFLVFLVTESQISALDGPTGEHLWDYRLEAISPATAPAGSHGYMFVPSWDKKVYGVNIADPNNLFEAWNIPLKDNVRIEPIYDNGGIYVATEGGDLLRIIETNGEVDWRLPLLDVDSRDVLDMRGRTTEGEITQIEGNKITFRFPYRALSEEEEGAAQVSYLTAVDTIYDKRVLQDLAVGDNVKVRYNRSLSDPSQYASIVVEEITPETAPIAADMLLFKEDFLLVGSLNANLYLIDRKKGRVESLFRARTHVVNRPITRGDYVYFSSRGSGVYCLKLEQQKETIPDPNNPAIVREYKRSNLAEQWFVPKADRFLGAGSNLVFLVADDDKVLMAVNKTSGLPVWNHRDPVITEFIPNPDPDSNLIYAYNANGMIYAFREKDHRRDAGSY